MLTRRQVLSLAAVALSCGRADAAAPIPSLGDIAERAGVLFGASIGHEIDSDPAYADLYAREACIVTTDTALKFDFLRPDAETFAFAAADRIIAFARRNALQVRGHTLAWNDVGQPWLRRLSHREIARVFDHHIDTVVTRYAGRLQSWDVVNEPFWPGNRRPGGYRQGPWLDAMGPDYIQRAFRRTAAIDKTARLCLNEAQCENDRWGAGIRPRLLGLIDALLDAGLPLHAVGLQAHLKPQWVSDPEAFPAFLAELAKRDVDIYVTELDVDDTTFVDDPVARDAAVAEHYTAFLGQVLAQPRVTMVVTWQLADRYSFYRALSLQADPDVSRLPRPLPFGEGFRRKPAWHAVARAFGRRADRRASLKREQAPR